MGALQIGPGIDAGNDLGAMVSVKERDKILDLLGEAADEGLSVDPVSTVPESGASSRHTSSAMSSTVRCSPPRGLRPRRADSDVRDEETASAWRTTPSSV